MYWDEQLDRLERGRFFIHRRHVHVHAGASVEVALDVDIITIVVVGIKLRCIGSAFGWLRYRRSQQFLVATTAGSFWVAVMAAGFEEGRTIGGLEVAPMVRLKPRRPVPRRIWVFGHFIIQPVQSLRTMSSSAPGG